jgi:hypothetical protein
MVARLTRHPARNPAVRPHLVPMGLLEPRRDAAIDAAAAAAAVTPAELSASAERRSVADPAGHELDRLYASLGVVTPENHPRTARLLRSSNRKVAQKVIEEAGGRARGGQAQQPRRHPRERRSPLPSGGAVAACRHRRRRHLDRDAPPGGRSGHCRKAAQGRARLGRVLINLKSPNHVRFATEKRTSQRTICTSALCH